MNFGAKLFCAAVQKLYSRICLMKVRLQLMFFGLVLLTVFGLLYNYHARRDLRLCFIDPIPLIEPLSSNGQLTRLQDILLDENKPTPGKSIFFHETSCQKTPFEGEISISKKFSINSMHRYKIIQLTTREACAIESAALHNPNSKVFVLFASPVYRENNATQPLLDAILSYPNVYLRNLNLWTYAAETPLYEWLKDGELFKSSYVQSHISDFLRYLSLWRWGGTYLDMDVIMLRTIEDLPPNYTGAESNTHLAAGVMNFAHDGFGHQVAEQCLHDFKRNFNGGDWGNNGPGVITRVMQSVCGTKNIAMMHNRKRCLGFQIFKRDAFYAIPWMEWERFFESDYLEDTLRRVKHSYLIHVWNKHSYKRQIAVGSNVAYGKLAEKKLS